MDQWGLLIIFVVPYVAITNAIIFWLSRKSEEYFKYILPIPVSIITLILWANYFYKGSSIETIFSYSTSDIIRYAFVVIMPSMLVLLTPILGYITNRRILSGKSPMVDYVMSILYTLIFTIIFFVYNILNHYNPN